MVAVVETSGHQFRVTAGDTIVVDRREEAEGSTVVLDRVLAIFGSNPKIGSPTVAGATVTAKVVGHSQGDKVITFKYRRRLRMRRRVGFRASLTTLEIVSVEG
jgi:large subunit ribosomal protein L21